jgi:hypothetical protein
MTEQAVVRHLAAVKAAATRAANRKRAHEAGIKAALTKASPPHKAKTTARKSQIALERWAKDNGWYPPVFLDAPSGNPRTGIVDAVLVRVSRDDADVIELRFVQLKSGLAGLKAVECERLEQAVKRIDIGSMYALCSGTHVTTMAKPRA